MTAHAQTAEAQLSLLPAPPARQEQPRLPVDRSKTCWDCDDDFGRAAVVTNAAQPGSAFWHRRCWKPWVNEQKFRRGRAPKAHPAD